jgi:hypothetical protein
MVQSSQHKAKPVFTSQRAWGAIHQLLNIILQLRILVLLPVTTLAYVVKGMNCSQIGE